VRTAMEAKTGADPSALKSKVLSPPPLSSQSPSSIFYASIWVPKVAHTQAVVLCYPPKGASKCPKQSTLSISLAIGRSGKGGK